MSKYVSFIATTEGPLQIYAAATLRTLIAAATDMEEEMDAQETKGAAVLARGYGQCAQVWRVLLAEQENRG